MKSRFIWYILMITLTTFHVNCQAQTFDWRSDGYINQTTGGTYENIDGSGIDLEVSGLYMCESLKDEVSIRTGINNQEENGMVHTYQFIFSEKVDLRFTISDINEIIGGMNCFSDYLLFSGHPVFLNGRHIFVRGDSLIIPEHGSNFKLPGNVIVQYKSVDTVTIVHGIGRGCNPGFIYISRLFINQNVAYKKAQTDSISLQNILFDTGKSELKPQYIAQLDTLANFLTSHPKAKVTLYGHTDNIGNEEANLSLSRSRVVTVYDYLINKKIESTRIKVESYGEAHPSETNETDEGRTENRRVEIRVLR